MTRLALIPVLAVALYGCQDSPTAVTDDLAPAFAAVATTDVENLPMSVGVIIPCTGDLVILEGTLHGVFHTTVTGNSFVSRYHYNPQQLTGVSPTTGARYQGTGVTQEVIAGSFTNGRFTDTYVNNFRMIGQGSGNNLLIHLNFHVTVNASGDVTVIHENASAECR